MTRVLVTGAGGHIGQRLVNRLAADGVGVRAIVRRSLDWPGGVEQVVGDLWREPGLAKEAARDVETVIHLAGANERALAGDPEGAAAESVTMAERIVESGAPRAIYLSTVHVYGAALAPDALIDESTPAAPLTPYAAVRLSCEEVFHRSTTPTMVFRLTNGIGAPLGADSPGWRVVAHELCREGAVKGEMSLRTAGVQWRDFVPLDDVERALSSVVRQPSFSEGTYNLASGTSITVRDLATEIQDSFERVQGIRPVLTAPAPPSDHPAPYRVGIAALERLRLFDPTPRHQALDALVRYCVDNRSSLA